MFQQQNIHAQWLGEKAKGLKSTARTDKVFVMTEMTKLQKPGTERLCHSSSGHTVSQMV